MGADNNHKKVGPNTICWFKELKHKVCIMLYNAPVKGDDGLYFVKALTDEKRKCFVQLNNVTVNEVTDELSFNLSTDANKAKIQNIDDLNLEAANENCSTWFGKQLSQDVIRSAYTPSAPLDQITGERIAVTKVFNSDQEIVDIDQITQGKRCSVILEFAGIWFAKKTFGPTWNVFQVKIFDEPNLEVYPEEYAFDDEETQ